MLINCIIRHAFFIDVNGNERETWLQQHVYHSRALESINDINDDKMLNTKSRFKSKDILLSDNNRIIGN